METDSAAQDSQENNDEPSKRSSIGPSFSPQPTYVNNNLTIEIDDWFLPNMAKLKQDAFALARTGGLQANLTVKLNAPRYLELREFVTTQARDYKDPVIAAEQHEALDRAKSALESTEKWGALLLVHMTKHYGLRAALNSFDFFLRLRLTSMVSGLASYQVDDGNVVCTEFPEWFERHNPFPTLAQFIYGSSPVLEVIVGDDPSVANRPHAETIFLPLAQVENSGSGDLLTNLRESAVHLSMELWIDYVVPQLTALEAAGIASYHAWTPDRTTYLTEGFFWLVDDRLELEGKRIDGTDIVVVARKAWRQPDASLKARQYLESVTDPPVKQSGPFRFFSPDTDLERIRMLADEVLEPITAVDARTFRAPSVWHAASWLMNNAAGVAENKEIGSSFPGISPAVKFGGPLLFRGATDSDSELRLTLSLSTAEESNALVRFMLALNSLNERAERTGLPSLIIDAIIGVGAHHGLSTYLLLMTLDPLIAILESIKLAPKDSEAAVYWIPFSKITSLGGRIIIPPIWAESLYDQKEVFLDFRDVALAEIKSESWKLLFPADSSFLDFEFPSQHVGASHDDMWLKSAMTWASDSQFEVTPDIERKADLLADELCLRLGEPPFVKVSGQPERMEQWCIRLANLLKWLMVKRNEEEFYFDCATIRCLSPYTYATLKWFAKFTEERQHPLTLSQEYRASETESVANAVRFCLRHLENQVD